MASLYHYTSIRALDDIEELWKILPSERGLFGPGIYCTDLNPANPDNRRGLISRKCWDIWIPSKMEAYITIPETMASYVKGRVFLVGGLSAVEITWVPGAGHWVGRDPDDEYDVGGWLPRTLARRPPPKT